MNDFLSSASANEFYENYDYYWLKYTMNRGVKEQAKFLLVGNSLARFGVNDRDIPGLINLAFISQDYYYSAKIIEKALTEINSLKHVIIGTAYYSPYMDLSMAKAYKERERVVRVYGRYFQDIHHMEVSKYDEMKKEILVNRTQFDDGCYESEIAKLYDQQKKDYFARKWKEDDFSPIVWTAAIPEEERYLLAKNRADYHNGLQKHHGSYEENKVLLQRLSKLCCEKKVKLSFVVFPSNRYYRRYLDLNLKHEYENQFEWIPAKYRPDNIDLFASEEFDSVTDFFDTDHLNSAGAAKMAGKIREYLES